MQGETPSAVDRPERLRVPHALPGGAARLRGDESRAGRRRGIRIRWPACGGANSRIERRFRAARLRAGTASRYSRARFSSESRCPRNHQIRPSEGLRHVKYEIRGRLARRAQELERQGYEIVPLNIGNPGAFGFRTPETMRLAMIENMAVAEGYCHQKGIFPAREAVVMQQQMRGVTGISAEEVFIGNGVSELIDLCLRALLNRRRRGADPEPRLSTVVGGGHAERRQGGLLPVPAGKRIRAGSGRDRRAGHAQDARHRRHQPEQPDRRGLSARGVRSHRAGSPKRTSSSCSATRSTTR